ncbi:MAG: Gfo/Idh/MocA family oxidoreductase [Oscillospiraceae bacterium]|nr:Gfo/Idh/MocA family oxidoreductase [Oscillospiraceae bacterium]
MDKTRVAVLGCGFISEIHVTAYKRFVPDAEVVAVYSHHLDKAQAYAEKMGIPAAYDDIDKLLAEVPCDIVDVCLPNYLHHDVCLKAANSGRHVIIEKPLCLSLEEADEMIAACEKNGKLLMYAEELCFAPKYERVRAIVESGAVGDVYMLRQCEKHSGPHSRWFYESDKSGGGVMMDMGCHALAWFMWMLKGAVPKSVYGNFMHVYHDTDAEDHSITQVEFEYKGKTVLGVGENSWVKQGGMQDCIEIYGEKGLCYSDLFQGNSSQMYSLEGYDYASEKAGATTGWTYPIFEEAFNQGYPQELSHFVDCVRNGKKPVSDGKLGRAVLEIIHAAYLSSKEGRKVALPYESKAKKPVDNWR